MITRIDTMVQLSYTGVGNKCVNESLLPICKVFPMHYVTCKGEEFTVDATISLKRSGALRMRGLGEKYTCLATNRGKQKEVVIYRDGDYWYQDE